MKRYINSALIYALLAMISGIAYREVTKFYAYTDRTTLGLVHTHYFLLGMVVFLVLLILEKQFSFTEKTTTPTLVVYHVGLNITAVMMALRGLTQVLHMPLSAGMNAALSGVAGIGHILLGIALILLLLQVRRHITV